MSSNVWLIEHRSPYQKRKIWVVFSGWVFFSHKEAKVWLGSDKKTLKKWRIARYTRQRGVKE